VIVDLDSIVHIGKESNELEETEALGASEDSYVEYVADADSERKMQIPKKTIRIMKPFGELGRVPLRIP
jgi:hypothetical protein